MIRVLFVCHGNICRSPMAEFILKDMVSSSHLSSLFHIESAATSTEEIWRGVGNPVYPPARRKLAEHGISCEGKRARQVTREDYDRFDYLIVMDENNCRNLLRIIGADSDHKVHKLMDYTEHHGDVADPWYTDDFDTCWQDIYDGCQGFLNVLKENGLV